MPSSTVWRRPSSSRFAREESPLRPTSVEPISPHFESSPSFFSYDEPSTHNLGHTSRLKGLGVSSPGFDDYSFSIPRPDRLYIDQNGGAHVRADGCTRGGRISGARHSSRSSRHIKGKGHTRSGSTIDDLASIAIASSPNFVDEHSSYAFSQETTFLQQRPATSHLNGYAHDGHGFERPSKRVKSEKLQSAEWSPNLDRPRTSHTYESPRIEEAELLLALSTGFAWQTSTSPSKALFRQTQDIPARPGESSQSHLEALNRIEESPTGKEKEAIDLHAQQGGDNPGIGNEDPFFENRQGYSPFDDGQKTQQNHAPAIVASTGTADAEPVLPHMTTEVPKTKRPRKIQPEVQEVCASCEKLQLYRGEEESTTQWIGCEHCKKWYHAICVGFRDKAEARSVDKFFCKNCDPEYGTTTFVRKSSRARTAIDYAGLNQGVVKPSDDSTVHHYIPLIKDGRIKVQPDDFARIRPELMTAHFWETMDGMKRPMVVPACWNPRFGEPRIPDIVDSLEAIPAKDTAHRTYQSNGSVVDRGEETDVSLNGNETSKSQEQVVDCDQDYLDMVMPRGLTVRKVSELYGPEQPVPVIDVKSQETKGQFTLNDWADYYEMEGEKPIRNVISLEVSQSRLGKLIRRPRVVRDIDLEDEVWDNETRNASNKRPVQFYCLMSVADSYTDFHIDFGGSSVYYHILKGTKTFFFIPPEDRYLKKYEDWCNSDIQNETWLGDLCNGNVTRVDLHEGDTAFIPAGWIHSVWTPEDSLVVGGNFLTRLDYELQLKVANIEKTTRVPQKFRYPFFQKVMWYALLKYLEEDPVPEDVMHDFYEDPEYIYLRANPIWHDVDALALIAEPGDAAYNVRLYPKSELKGLPSLRDFLYRTARIYADLPVPDINKKQVEAVKASIPKGYGDPMQLIKTFAVWCAWKIGNEAVPGWVHIDAGLLPEITELEKVKKPEVFRVPPERVSARKAQQSTPVLAEDVIATPVKLSPSSDGDQSAKKLKNITKGSGTRMACTPCRKRRIKCRHREGEEALMNPSPADIRPRTFSNVSLDIPNLTTASPAHSAFEDTPASVAGQPELGNTSDLAQAALASLHAQSSESGSVLPSLTTPGSAKKGRSKACDECRKSKRRCVHDQFGRVDPAKAAEPSKPRGSTGTKRAARPSDVTLSKISKLDIEIDPALLDSFEQFPEMPPGPGELSTSAAQVVKLDSMIDPKFTAPVSSSSIVSRLTPALVSESALVLDDPAQESPPSRSHTHSAAVSPISSISTPVMNGVHAGSALGQLSVPEDVKPMPASSRAQMIHLRPSPIPDTSYSPITTDSNAQDVAETTERQEPANETSHPNTPGSRHSSRQPKQVNRNVPDDDRSPSKTPSSKLASRQRRDSSSTPSLHTAETAVKSRRCSSNTSGTIHQAAMSKQEVGTYSLDRPGSQGSDADGEIAADEMFARELQAAENGLRRRASVRA